MTVSRLVAASVCIISLAACGSQAGQAGGSTPEDAQDVTPISAADLEARDSRSTEPYDGIGPDERLRFTGTEPFWGGEVTGETLIYSTLENQDGTELAVERFAGRGGLAFSGELDGGPFEMMVTPLSCSDGMSDRKYPFTVTLQVGGETRNGCGWSDARPFEGPQNP